MGLRDDILTQARARLGVPYRIDPPPDGVRNLDCSLYVLKVYEAAGVPLSGVRTAEQIRAAMVPIAFADVLPGDALFFDHTYEPSEPSAVGDGHVASHIGISLGAGTRRMLNAVEPVSTETNIATPYWQDHLFEARRLPALVGQADTGGNPETAPAEMPRGIDVSSNNGSIDWPAVAASGVSFAWIKVSEDDGYLNPRFETDWLLAKRVGLVRGAYHFARPDRTGDGSDAAQEADWMLDQIALDGGLEPGDMLALDLESGAGDLGQWALDFLHRCEARVGFKPFVYTAGWFSGPHELDLQPTLADYPLWQAYYGEPMPAPIAPWSRITIWQQSSSGRVPGISGDVDMNVSTVSLDALRALGMPASDAVAALPSEVGTAAPSPADDPGAWISALAYLADDVAAIEDRDARLAEAQRVREQFVGAKPASRRVDSERDTASGEVQEASGGD